MKFLSFLALKVDTDRSNKYDRIRGRGKFGAEIIFKVAEVLEVLHENRLDSQFVFMFMRNPIEYLEKIVFHDALYKDTQYSPESILLLLESVINDNKDLFTQKFNMLPRQFIEISRAIIKYAKTEIEKGIYAKLVVSPYDVLNEILNPPAMLGRIE